MIIYTDYYNQLKNLVPLILLYGMVFLNTEVTWMFLGGSFIIFLSTVWPQISYAPVCLKTETSMTQYKLFNTSEDSLQGNGHHTIIILTTSHPQFCH
jgi:hypothetical protein